MRRQQDHQKSLAKQLSLLVVIAQESLDLRLFGKTGWNQPKKQKLKVGRAHFNWQPGWEKRLAWLDLLVKSKWNECSSLFSLLFLQSLSLWPSTQQDKEATRRHSSKRNELIASEECPNICACQTTWTCMELRPLETVRRSRPTRRSPHCHSLHTHRHRFHRFSFLSFWQLAKRLISLRAMLMRRAKKNCYKRYGLLHHYNLPLNI